MTTSLTALRDWARHQADHPHTPQTERTLWTQIADELDEYLGQPPEATDLFGALTAEPTSQTDH